MSALLDAALAYADRGWAVFPLKPGDKRPFTSHGHKDASSDPDQIRAWWAQWPEANIGLPTGAGNGISVLDVDVKAGAKGEETLSALLQSSGISLDGYAQARTWSGGRHIVFAYSELARTGAGCYGPGLDGRNDGGYIVAVPSVIEGQAYRWIVEPDAEALLPWPGWLQSARSSSNGASAESPDWADELMLAGVDKGERDNAAWSLISHARSTGKTKAECIARITLFGSRCRPPFDPATDENIAGKIERAYSKPRLGVATERKWSEGVPQDQPRQQQQQPVGLQTVAAVQERLGRAGNWLVDRMLAVGDLSILVAKPGIGKSTFAAQLAVAVAYGRRFLGRECRQGSVVYLAFEGVRSTVTHMVRMGHDPKSEAILIYRGDGADSKSPAAWLAETVKGHQPALIVIDTLTDFARATPGASNAGYEDMMQKLGAVYAWAQAQRCHVLLLHHGGKGDKEGIDTALGSIGIVGKPGTVLDFRPLSKEKGAPRVLSGVKHREGDVEEDLPALVLDFDRERGLTVAGFREDVQVRELGVAIIKVVWDEPGVKQVDALGAVEGRKTAKLEALRRLLAEDGVLAREGAGNGSKVAPYRLSIRPGIAGDPVAVWRERQSPRWDAQVASRFPVGSQALEPTQVHEESGVRAVGSRSIVEVGNLHDQEREVERDGSREYTGPAQNPLAQAPPPAAAGPYCPTCHRWRCFCGEVGRTQQEA